MMKSKYVIGLFAVVLIFGILLSAGYQITYDRVVERQAALEDESVDTKSIEADVKAAGDTGTEEGEEEGYYLCEMQGFVVVYLSDRSTVYELTEIPLTDLPEEIQHEIASGKFIADKEELYGFLENYSS